MPYALCDLIRRQDLAPPMPSMGADRVHPGASGKSQPCSVSFVSSRNLMVISSKCNLCVRVPFV